MPIPTANAQQVPSRDEPARLRTEVASLQAELVTLRSLLTAKQLARLKRYRQISEAIGKLRDATTGEAFAAIRDRFGVSKSEFFRIQMFRNTGTFSNQD
jgi:hypothetical protein